MDNPIISARGINKSYDDFTLGPLDFDLESGFVIAVVGPNGSGKTTLFRLLMNLAQPDSGEIKLFSQQFDDAEFAIKQRLAFLPEDPIGYEDMNAKQLSRFVAYWYPTWNSAYFEQLLHQFEIPLDKPYEKLSSGMKRRLSFTVALATDVELLLLDEPTKSVDPFTRREMLEAVSTFMQDGDRTVVFATHVMEEVRRLADYIMFVSNGEFLGLLEKDTLLDQWKTLWVDRLPDEPIVGVVDVEQGAPIRLVTSDHSRTLDALWEENIRVVRSSPVDLEEILGYMMDNSSRRQRIA